MDWLIIGGALLAGWMMLSVLSGERMNRSQQMAVALAKTAAEKAKQMADVPTALSASAQPAIPAAALNRKR